MQYAKTEFETRLARHYDELKWLYCELYHDDGVSRKIDFEKGITRITVKADGTIKTEGMLDPECCLV